MICDVCRELMEEGPHYVGIYGKIYCMRCGDKIMFSWWK